MEKLFYNNKDIRDIYGISQATAFNHMKRIREIYEIDESRLPKKGLLPVKMVKEYFDQSKHKKTSPKPCKASDVKRTLI